MRKIFITFLLLRSAVSISLQNSIENSLISQHEMFNRLHHPLAMVQASRKNKIQKLWRPRHVQNQRSKLRKSFRCLLIDTFLDPYFNGKKVCLFGPKQWNCILIKFLLVNKNRPLNFFGVKEFFFVNFDFKYGCKNEFEDNKEKSCSRFKNRFPPTKSILEPIGLTSPTRQPAS